MYLNFYLITQTIKLSHIYFFLKRTSFHLRGGGGYNSGSPQGKLDGERRRGSMGGGVKT